MGNICDCIKAKPANDQDHEATGGGGHGHSDSRSPLHSPYDRESLHRLANLLSDVHAKLKEGGEEVGKTVAATTEATKQKLTDGIDEVSKEYIEKKVDMEQKWKDTKDDMNKCSSMPDEALKDGVEMVTSVVDAKKTEVKEKYLQRT